MRLKGPPCQQLMLMALAPQASSRPHLVSKRGSTVKALGKIRAKAPQMAAMAAQSSPYDQTAAKAVWFLSDTRCRCQIKHTSMQSCLSDHNMHRACACFIFPVRATADPNGESRAFTAHSPSSLEGGGARSALHARASTRSRSCHELQAQSGASLGWCCWCTARARWGPPWPWR